MGNSITLYHGSIHLFGEIDVSRGKPFKDFGMGFYVSPNVEHAENLARRNRAVEEARMHSFDVVIGPTANDNTRVTIRAFFAGACGDVQSDRAIDTLIALIEPGNLTSQFYCGSKKTASMLKFIERREIK
jgi:hypothetical protein